METMETIAIIALNTLEDWGVVWLAFFVVGLVGYIAIFRISDALFPEQPPWLKVLLSAVGGLWTLMLFAFADWWWQLGFMY